MVSRAWWFRTAACGLCFAAAFVVVASPFPQEAKCKIGEPDKCVKAHGWKEAREWDIDTELKVWERAVRNAKAHPHAPDSLRCGKVRRAALGALKQAIFREEGKGHPGAPVHFYRGTQHTKGIGADDGAQFIRVRGKDTETGDTIVLYDILAFDDDLWADLPRLFRAIQHEAAHYMTAGTRTARPFAVISGGSGPIRRVSI